ncbi:immunoglobulin-like domain-containing protein, partial [Pseudomonas sp. NPDC089996]|uniref:immunoglobulin-like domain-containing protein n=1 Tax=Pseudomonas sp. NPDC089996 TaxID=3364474 RepID=UPI00381EB3A3
FTAVNGGNFEAVDLTGATTTATVEDTVDTTTVAVSAEPAKEGDTNVTFNFQLSNPPQAGTTVTLTVNVGGTNYTVNVDSTGKGTLQVPNANGDDVYTDPSKLTATVTAVNGGNFEAVDLTGATTTATVEDTVDTTTVAVSAEPAKEGDTNVTFNFQLSNPPQTATTLTVNVGGTIYTVEVDVTGKGSLQVPNTNVEDVYVDASDVTATVTAVNGGNYEIVDLAGASKTVTVEDTETPVTAVVTAAPVNEGQDITFNFAMSTAPRAGSDPVVLNVKFGDVTHQVTLDATGHGSLTVANPNGEDVFVDAGSLSVNVLGGTGGGYEKIGASTGSVQVNDTETPVTAVVTAAPVNEGQDITFNFAMSTAPRAGSEPVVLNVKFGDVTHQVTLDATGHGSLTVANPNGEDVFVDAGSLSVNVLGGTGGGYEKIGASTGTVDVRDTETPVTAVVTAAPVNEGQDITFNFAMSTAPRAGSDPVVLNVKFG